MSKPLELLVFGTGAVGSVFGWRTAQNANVKLSAICRSNYEIVKNRGLTFRSNMWGTGSMRPARVARHASELSHVKFDYVVCATKNKPQEEQALMRSLEPLLSKDTTLVLIQNGVEIEHPFRRAFPNHTLLSSICFASCSMQGSTVLQPANIRPHGFHVGIHGNGNTSASKDEERLHTLVGLDPKFKAVDNIATERWAKMAWNGAWNPATALFGLETQDILQHSPAGTSLVRQLAKEVIQVAQVYGVELPPNYEDEIIRMTEVEASIAPSMLQDLRRGQRMEVETICGTICRMADQVGLPHPAMATAYSTLSEMNLACAETPLPARQDKPALNMSQRIRASVGARIGARIGATTAPSVSGMGMQQQPHQIAA